MPDSNQCRSSHSTCRQPCSSGDRLAEHQREQIEDGERAILLVEDDVDLAAVLKALLQSYGYSVCVAHRGVQGVWDILTRDFDVIVCDLVMPTMPGDMFYLAVQKVKPHLSRRFLFVTGHQLEPRIADFLGKVERPILIKPLATGDLLLHIGAILDETARRRELALEPLQVAWYPATVSQGT